MVADDLAEFQIGDACVNPTVLFSSSHFFTISICTRVASPLFKVNLMYVEGQSGDMIGTILREERSDFELQKIGYRP